MYIVSNIRRFAHSAYPVDIGVHDSLTCTRLYYFQTLLSSLQDFENRCLGVFHVSSFGRSKKPRLLRPQWTLQLRLPRFHQLRLSRVLQKPVLMSLLEWLYLRSRAIKGGVMKRDRTVDVDVVLSEKLGICLLHINNSSFSLDYTWLCLHLPRCHQRDRYSSWVRKYLWKGINQDYNESLSRQCSQSYIWIAIEDIIGHSTAGKSDRVCIILLSSDHGCLKGGILFCACCNARNCASWGVIVSLGDNQRRIGGVYIDFVIPSRLILSNQHNS